MLIRLTLCVKKKSLWHNICGTSVLFQSQLQRTERQIRKEFENLRQFLRDEEEARIEALRQEEELKSLTMKTRIEETNREKARLQGVIRKAMEGMDVADVAFLQVRKGSRICFTYTQTRDPFLFIYLFIYFTLIRTFLCLGY